VVSVAFHGVAYGMILYVISVGLSVTMGLMGFTNLAHGVFAMAGGYILTASLGRFGLPFPNHIKIDVDGIEAAIIRGARQSLRNARLKSVLVEVFMHGSTADQVKAVFFEAGWTLHNADVIDYTPGIVQNLIFRRSP